MGWGFFALIATVYTIALCLYYLFSLIRQRRVQKELRTFGFEVDPSPSSAVKAAAFEEFGAMPRSSWVKPWQEARKQFPDSKGIRWTAKGRVGDAPVLIMEHLFVAHYGKGSLWYRHLCAVVEMGDASGLLSGLHRITDALETIQDDVGGTEEHNANGTPSPDKRRSQAEQLKRTQAFLKMGPSIGFDIRARGNAVIISSGSPFRSDLRDLLRAVESHLISTHMNDDETCTSSKMVTSPTPSP